MDSTTCLAGKYPLSIVHETQQDKPLIVNYVTEAEGIQINKYTVARPTASDLIARVNYVAVQPYYVYYFKFTRRNYFSIRKKQAECTRLSKGYTERNAIFFLFVDRATVNLTNLTRM